LRKGPESGNMKRKRNRGAYGGFGRMMRNGMMIAIGGDGFREERQEGGAK